MIQSTPLEDQSLTLISILTRFICLELDSSIERLVGSAGSSQASSFLVFSLSFPPTSTKHHLFINFFFIILILNKVSVFNQWVALNFFSYSLSSSSKVSPNLKVIKFIKMTNTISHQSSLISSSLQINHLVVTTFLQWIITSINTISQTVTCPLVFFFLHLECKNHTVQYP